MFEGKRDVILFCIDCSESMLQLYDDPKYEDVKTCHLFAALEAAMQIEKKKIIVGPNDSVGIMLFNTVGSTHDYELAVFKHLSRPESPSTGAMLPKSKKGHIFSSQFRC